MGWWGGARRDGHFFCLSHTPALPSPRRGDSKLRRLFRPGQLAEYSSRFGIPPPSPVLPLASTPRHAIPRHAMPRHAPTSWRRPLFRPVDWLPLSVFVGSREGPGVAGQGQRILVHPSSSSYNESFPPRPPPPPPSGQNRQGLPRRPHLLTLVLPFARPPSPRLASPRSAWPAIRPGALCPLPRALPSALNTKY